jgi:hypothetical protein
LTRLYLQHCRDIPPKMVKRPLVGPAARGWQQIYQNYNNRQRQNTGASASCNRL